MRRWSSHLVNPRSSPARRLIVYAMLEADVEIALETTYTWVARRSESIRPMKCPWPREADLWGRYRPGISKACHGGSQRLEIVRVSRVFW